MFLFIRCTVVVVILVWMCVLMFDKCHTADRANWQPAEHDMLKQWKFQYILYAKSNQFPDFSIVWSALHLNFDRGNYYSFCLNYDRKIYPFPWLVVHLFIAFCLSHDRKINKFNIGWFATCCTARKSYIYVTLLLYNIVFKFLCYRITCLFYSSWKKNWL